MGAWQRLYGRNATAFIHIYRKNKRVRPAFEPEEFRQLWRALKQWIDECTDERHLHTRELLRDYVAVLVFSGMRVGEANAL